MELKFKVKLKVETKEIKVPPNMSEPIEIESGAFDDTKHYSGLSTAYLYGIQLYGTDDGRIPSRNVLVPLNAFINTNIERLIGIYVNNIFAGPEIVGHLAGSFINSQHMKLIQDFGSPPNAPSTVKQKGFNNPLIDKGELVSQIFYSINGNGRYK